MHTVEGEITGVVMWLDFLFFVFVFVLGHLTPYMTLDKNSLYI
jgi:hypothetical protein